MNHGYIHVNPHPFKRLTRGQAKPFDSRYDIT